MATEKYLKEENSMKRKLAFNIAFLSFAVALSGQQISNENLRIMHGPYIQNLTYEGVTIIWHTNLPSVPSVVLTLPGGETRVVQNSHDGIIDGGSTMHKVRLSSLEPGTEYNYIPVSTEILKYQAYRVYRGDTLARGNFSFRTPEKDQDKVNFSVFNDIHGRAALLSSFLTSPGTINSDLFFFNGDMIDYLQDENQLFNGFIDTAVSCFATSKPFYYVRGNHETRGMLARELKKYFDFPSGRFYYSFTQGPVRFIVLDCGEDKPDDNRYYYGLADYDNYRFAELEWLRNELQTKDRDDYRFTIVIIHMPVIKGEQQGYGMQFLSDHFGPVLSEAGIDLMISGHTHRNAYITEDESGFGYPVVVSSNKTFTEFEATRQEIRWKLKDSEGIIIESGVIK